ncbi:MAG: hypothetical protein P0Y64_16650 [Candidatus Sphingomonas colombiensis]|nr:hypothetical protein [Sphingomonas sp.]WEK42949.1 MAG: hypothetical protein P0Y64_16650 [Sphingomonas sp.]
MLSYFFAVAIFAAGAGITVWVFCWSAKPAASFLKSKDFRDAL